jgi:hypothetical protein
VAPKGGTAEGLGLKGIVNIVVRDASGNVKYEKTYENNIQGAGYLALLNRGFDKNTLTQIADLGTNAPKLAFDYIRICSSEATLDEKTGEITAAPEEITTGVDRDTLSVTISQVTVGSSYKVEVQQSFTVKASGGITIRSIELTDEEEDTPTVFSYIDIADISLNQNDSITITWTIMVSGN